MWFLNYIVSRLVDISNFFYSAYLEVWGWVYPFYLLSYPLYNLYYAFNQLARNFYDFNTWVDDAAIKLANILSWSTIWSYILSWLPNLDDVNSWFYDWWGNVTSVINSWWASTSITVQGWIDAGQQWLQSQINTINTLLASLQSQVSELTGQLPSLNEILSWFSNWWGNVLAQVIAWGALTTLQIQSLIDSAFTVRGQFWAGWQDVRDNVIDFFTDPWGWLYNSFDDFIERYW